LVSATASSPCGLSTIHASIITDRDSGFFIPGDEFPAAQGIISRGHRSCQMKWEIKRDEGEQDEING
jgi:hypothetical protein